MAKLFLTLALLCVFGAVVVKGYDFVLPQSVMIHMQPCMTEVGADDDTVTELMQDSTNMSMKAKCLFACLLKKTNLMDDNGKFVKETALASIHNSGDENNVLVKIAEEIVNICATTEVDNDPCEAALQYGICFKNLLQSFLSVNNS